ncbi:PA2779 family protein [Alteromonas sp. ASW11-19]|uniref:PA2779 family protein n=1 Tax=Alteromonas salexigens TaxID=2982530 RepID=A0ABT2VPK0_9ALTE|nr:PA2779 family protein [Alteromonas salexigens]MCU7555229.1 PA2779 family protein [Alteromonas salexigens]
MRKLASTGVALLTMLVCLSGQAHAEAISSASVMQAQTQQFTKQQLVTMVNREDVQERLISLGVDKQHAIARINAMTPSELNQLNEQLNDAPAGGVVGAIITVFAIIAVLDLLGVTDVYSFIRPINS